MDKNAEIKALKKAHEVLRKKYNIAVSMRIQRGDMQIHDRDGDWGDINCTTP